MKKTILLILIIVAKSCFSANKACIIQSEENINMKFNGIVSFVILKECDSLINKKAIGIIYSKKSLITNTNYFQVVIIFVKDGEELYEIIEPIVIVFKSNSNEIPKNTRFKVDFPNIRNVKLNNENIEDVIKEKLKHVKIPTAKLRAATLLKTLDEVDTSQKKHIEHGNELNDFNVKYKILKDRNDFISKENEINLPYNSSNIRSNNIPIRKDVSINNSEFEYAFSPVMWKNLFKMVEDNNSEHADRIANENKVYKEQICEPKIDEKQNRVVNRNKILTYSNGKLIHEGECVDTLKFYNIEKDYNCSECDDKIDFIKMKASATYKKYWIDEYGRKKYISQNIFIDEDQTFDIIRESNNCQPIIDIQNMQVYPALEYVYLNRVNTKKTAKGCHKSDKEPPVTIKYSIKGCIPTSDFQQNWSILQRNAVYHWKGEIKEVIPCTEFGRPIPHEFDTALCKPHISMNAKHALLLGKRFITFNNEKIIINDQCEPFDQTIPLQQTREGCEGLYEHNFDAGKTFLKKRWYYQINNEKEFVTECLISDEFLLHNQSIVGYKHDDQNKLSFPIITISIVSDNVNYSLSIKNGNPIPYEYIKDEDKITNQFMYDGCYKLTKTIHTKLYKRLDNSTYMLELGDGRPIKGSDECKRKTEERQVYDHTVIYDIKSGKVLETLTGNSNKYGVSFKKQNETLNQDTKIECSELDGCPKMPGLWYKRIYRIERRIEIEYPTGQVDKTPWMDTGIRLQV